LPPANDQSDMSYPSQAYSQRSSRPHKSPTTHNGSATTAHTRAQRTDRKAIERKTAAKDSSYGTLWRNRIAYCNFRTLSETRKSPALANGGRLDAL
jgi:hypothetical protein